jgi:hypothetical protein
MTPELEARIAARVARMQAEALRAAQAVADVSIHALMFRSTLSHMRERLNAPTMRGKSLGRKGCCGTEAEIAAALDRAAAKLAAYFGPPPPGLLAYLRRHPL